MIEGNKSLLCEVWDLVLTATTRRSVYLDTPNKYSVLFCSVLSVRYTAAVIASLLSSPISPVNVCYMKFLLSNILLLIPFNHILLASFSSKRQHIFLSQILSYSLFNLQIHAFSRMIPELNAMVISSGDIHSHLAYRQFVDCVWNTEINRTLFKDPVRTAQ